MIGAASAVVAVAAFILIAPAFLRPGADRLALVQTPRDYGVAFETVEFRPPDQPIKVRAWWMPVEPAKAAIILVHGGGDDNRSLPYADGLMEFRDRSVRVEEGEFIIVPRGIEHRPVADEEVHVVLFEPASTVNTGDVQSELLTVTEPERI